MAAQFDLAPVAIRVTELLPAIDEEMFSDPTPCGDYTVGDLLAHFVGLAGEFRRAATKETVEIARRGGSPVAAGKASVDDLDPEWRTLLPQRLTALAQSWQSPAAWVGMTMAGGVDLPAEVAARVAADELVVHGWDLATATGQRFDPDVASVQACYEFTQAMAQPGANRDGLFGPIVEIGENQPLLHQALGLAGRDPDWSLTG